MDSLFKRSLHSKELLEMIYVDGMGSMTQRIIRVRYIRESHIVAYCYHRRQVRSFKKDSILSAYPHQRRKDVANG